MQLASKRADGFDLLTVPACEDGDDIRTLWSLHPIASPSTTMTVKERILFIERGLCFRNRKLL